MMRTADGECRGGRARKRERGETRPETVDGRGARECRGGREEAETRLGTATPGRAINDSGAEFRDAEILSV